MFKMKLETAISHGLLLIDVQELIAYVFDSEMNMENAISHGVLLIDVQELIDSVFNSEMKMETAISHGLLLIDVQELIASVFNSEENIVDFATLRSVLVMLAAQMRFLEQEVEIRFTEQGEMFTAMQTKIDSKKTKKFDDADIDETEADTAGGKTVTGTISVTEVIRRGATGTDSKMLIVEKGTTSLEDITGSQTRIGSIEVVTMSQFNLLQDLVKELMSRVEDMSTPTMPADAELIAKLSKGTASLPATMDAVQLKERLKIAEQALSKMAVLLTRLVIAGILPPGVADTIAEMAIALGIPLEELGELQAIGAADAKQPGSARFDGVTPPQLQKAMENMVKDMTKKIDDAASKSATLIDVKELTVKGIVEKLDKVLEIDTRLNALYSLVSDYGEHLEGFSNGLDSQLKLYKEQITEMEANLTVALNALEATSNRPDSSGLIDLKTNHELVLQESGKTVYWHNVIIEVQKQRALELKRMIECVEKLSSELADRDEVADRMRDKANLGRLKSIITADDFEKIRVDLEARIHLCYEKFDKQKKVWQDVINDLSHLVAMKADNTLVDDLYEFMMHGLDSNAEILRRLSILFGVPETMLLARDMNGSLRGRARLERPPAPQPPRSAARYEEEESSPLKLPPILIKDQLYNTCLRDKKSREHICNRWVGGSHTLLASNVTRQGAPLMEFNLPPVRKYTAPGPDNHIYFMETELQPCDECNKLATEKNMPLPVEVCGGDTVVDA